MPLPTKPCKYCQSLSHWPYQCYQRTKKPKPLKRTAIKQRGKHAELWTMTRKAWFAAHPAETYKCHYCSTRMPRNMTTLDHLKSRSRSPELRYEFSNLVPCCWKDNTLKGSKSHDQYCKSCVI